MALFSAAVVQRQGQQYGYGEQSDLWGHEQKGAAGRLEPASSSHVDRTRGGLTAARGAIKTWIEVVYDIAATASP